MTTPPLRKVREMVGLLTAAALAPVAPDAGADIYVNHAATGANNGTSWENAFTSLHAALAATTAENYAINIAAGVYPPSGAADGYDRTRAFEITKNVLLFGGFSQAADGSWSRDVDGTPTILDGDLRGDDVPNFANRSDNSIHVIRARHRATPSGPVNLDGLHIRGGNANGIADTSEGGGILIEGNTVDLFNCRIYDNQAAWKGGGVACEWINVRPRRTIFAGNDAPFGSAYSAPTLEVNTCLFVGNGALTGGAALHSVAQAQGSSVRGCTFSANPGGAIFLAGPNHWTFDRVLTSIFWDNGPLPIATTRDISVTGCDVQGGYAGDGNIAADPRFVDSLGPDGVAGTIDDNLRLRQDSPCVNAGRDFHEGYDFENRPRVQQCAADIGAFESSYFPDCDENNLSDDCEIRDDPALDANQDGRLDRCDGSPPDSNGNQNDNGEPDPNQNDNGADQPNLNGNDNGVDSPDEPSDDDNSNPPSDDGGGVGFAACSIPVALASAMVLMLQLRHGRRQPRRRAAD